MISAFENYYRKRISNLASFPPQTRRRAQFVVAFSWLGILFGLVVALFYLAIGHNVGALIITVCSAAFSLVPVLIRSGLRSDRAGNYICAVLLAGFFSLAWVEGGITGHAVAWLVTIPICSILLTSGRSAYLWSAAALLAALFTARAELFGISPSIAHGEGSRTAPKAAIDHPGNIFVRGEDVSVTLPEKSSWVLAEYDDQMIRAFERGGKISAGALPVGFYRFKEVGTSNWISAAVIERLTAPTPFTSPIGIDVAMAWFYKTNQMNAVANLCALAGVNWVRDRLSWPEMEARRGEFSAPNKYDASAIAQSAAGLRVLQVIHQSPSWANPNGKRFPVDLRDAYGFYEAMARRWRGKVQAFEPWNEADIPMFGGHTGAEMAALQKAAYFGLKSGNPEMIACLNVFAMHNTNQLADFQANHAWPYFDTYNLHHYEAFEKYPRLYADHRAVSAGRPLWVSECAVPVKWIGDEKLKEPSDHDLKIQAERVAKTFACSLHEGSAATFDFLLPHYVEGQTQFGILRPDLTPRPAYVALAAAGRLLADARPLGRLDHSDDAVRAYLFFARPDGIERNVLVAWTTNKMAQLELKDQPAGVFDHLGRSREARKELELSNAPTFAFLSPASAKALILRTPPSPAPPLDSARCAVVMQALWPEEKIDLGKSAYVIRPGEREIIPVVFYNFGTQTLDGRLATESTPGLQAEFPESIRLAAMSRVEGRLAIKSAATNLATIRIRGEFGAEGESVLSLRMIAK